MNYQAILDGLSQNAAKLITLGGTINPYVGGAVALIIAVLLFWLSWKNKGQIWSNTKADAGKVVNDTGASQDAAQSVQDKSDEFFGDKPKS